MTRTDLRIKYRLETGKYPVYNDSTYYSFTGNLLHDYAAWLESFIPANKIHDFRAEYSRGKYGTYTSDATYPQRYNKPTYYMPAYKEYLEEYIIENHVFD